MKTLDALVAILLVIGGLNWGLVGFFKFDLVATIFGDMTAATRTIYSLVGLSALYDIVFIKGIWRRWGIQSGRPAHA